MDKQLQEARRAASTDPTEENLLRVFNLESKQGLHPFRNSQEIFDLRRTRDRKRLEADEQMSRLLEAIKLALADEIDLFELHDAVAGEGKGPRPYASLDFNGSKSLQISAMDLSDTIAVSVRLIDGSARNGRHETELGVSYTRNEDFPGNLPEKICAAITLYGN